MTEPVEEVALVEKLARAMDSRMLEAVVAVAMAYGAEKRNEGIEAAARVVEKNAEVRFEEHGTREWDTNACYYEGAAGETYEALDEECETIATAIRALKEPE